MKVLLVNTYDIGGAANACLRLHEGLLNSSIDSSVLLKQSQRKIPFSYEARPLEQTSKKEKFKSIIKKALKKLKILNDKNSKQNQFIRGRSANLEMFSFPYSNYDITQSSVYKEADIINLHWVANFLDYTSFFKKNNKPVVWTLHDMNPFTGGEHYEEKYLGMDETGRPKERIYNEVEKKIIQQNLEIKREIINSVDNLLIVAPSKWLVNEAKKSEIFKKKNVIHIPYGLNKEVYSMRNKEYSKGLFGIPRDKKIILFVAESVSNSRKGFNFLIKAFKQLPKDNIMLCAIGRKNPKLESIENLMQLGTINDERLMSIAYSAADVFVIPSLMDNLPNTVLESLMCGTPVIGFPVGGIVDMIQNGVNGYVTEEVSSDALQQTILFFLNKDDSFDRRKIRDNASKEYDLKIQAERYSKLYKQLIKFD